jgi:phosphoribosylformylglycinamidine synthase
MSEACSFFRTPITGGNVSFYNETFGGDIYPTPVIGMVGLIEDISLVTKSSFQDAGDSIVLVESVNRLVGKVNLEEEQAVQYLVAAAIRDRLVKSAHDVSEGGLVVALAECCFSTLHRGPIGADVRIPSHLEVLKDLFGESATRVVLSVKNAAEMMRRAGQMGLNCQELGKVGGTRLIMTYESERVIDLPVGELEAVWRQGLPKLLS